jgi:2-phospho-L-lactate guanylyltransferase (CobY/MobA/RfbA family)
MVTDRHSDGTNVLSFPIASSFTTAYGPGSLDNHMRAAQASGLAYEIIEDASLSLDLDTADDLTELERRRKDTP